MAETEDYSSFFAKYKDAGAPAAAPGGEDFSGFFQKHDPAPTLVKPSANPGPLSQSPDDGVTESTAKLIGTGVLKGVSHIPGFVGDARGLGDYLIDWTTHKVTGRPLAEVQAEHKKWSEEGERAIYGDSWMRYISPKNLPSGADIAAAAAPYTGMYEPPTTGGRILMGGIEAATGSPVGAVTRGAKAMGALGEAARFAPYAGVGGAAATTASEYGVENPFLLMGAGLAGTAAAQKAAVLAGKGYTSAIDVVGPAWEARPDVQLPDGSILPGTKGTPGLRSLPGVEGSTWRQAAEKFKGATTDRDAALMALGTESHELVPGSRATTAQVTGDPGQQVMERAMATGNKEPWLVRMGEQQAAQTRAVQGVAPEADIQALPRSLAQRQRESVAAMDAEIAAASARATNQAADLGGLGGAAAAGTQIEQALRPIWDNLVTSARAAADGLGARALEVVGQETRDLLNRRYATAREYVSRLYRAVERANPTLDVTRLRNGLATAYQDLTPEARMGLHPAEMPLVSMIGSYEPGMPFRRLRDLETQINQALAETKPGAPNASPAAYRRIGMLRSALEDTYANAAAGTLARETNAVARGDLAPEATLATALANLRAEADAFLERSGANYRINIGADGTARRGTVPPGNGGEVPPPSRPVDATTPEAVPPASGLDPSTLEDLRAARAARRDQGIRFERDPVAPAIATDRNNIPTLPAERVPAQFFRSDREGGGTRMDAYLAAAGPNGAAQMRAYAAQRLREAALTPEGTLDPVRAAQFLEQHQGALNRIPGAAEQFRAAAEAGANVRSLEPYTPGTPPEVLPTHFFRAGPSGAEGVRTLRRLLGDGPADVVMSDYAASLIQNKAVVNGMVDEGKLRSLVQTYRSAFGELPDVRTAAESAAGAANLLAEAAKRRATAVADMEKSTLGKIAGAATDAEVKAKVGNMLGSASGERELSQLIDAIKASPDADAAMSGLRRAAAEHVAERVIGNGEPFAQGLDAAKLRSDQAQSFIRKNEARLRLALGDDGFHVLEAVARDLKRQQRSITGGSLPARSNTVPDAVQLMRWTPPEPGQSWFSSIWQQFTPQKGLLAYFIGAPAAVAAGTAEWAGALAGRLRAAGLQSQQDFLTAMLMHPEIGAKALMEMPRDPKPTAPFIRALGSLSVMATPETKKD